MRIAILTPQFAPDLHDLCIMLQSNIVVWMDTVVWSRKSRVHRAKIRTPQGTQWIYIPVKSTHRKQPLKNCIVEPSEKWLPSLKQALQTNYGNSIYYDYYAPEIEALLKECLYHKNLAAINLFIFTRIMRFLELDIHPVWHSDLAQKSSHPYDFIKKKGAAEIILEHDSSQYLPPLQDAVALPFAHPVYKQHFPGFEPGCSVLDVLFECGPESFKVLDELKS